MTKEIKLSRRQKIAISSIVIVCVVIASGWIGYVLREKGVTIWPKSVEKPEEKGKVVSVGYGWSVKSDEDQAVEEAISSVKIQLENKTPEFVLLFSTVGYDSAKVLSKVRALLGNNTQIYGGTSCLAVQTKDDFHVGETGSLTLLAVSSKNITFGVGGVSIDDYPSAREAGKAAIRSAINATGKEGQPKLVLMTVAPGQEEDILAGIENVTGKDVPVIGGSSGDNDITGKWKQFANDQVYSNGISLTAIYTNLKVGWAYEAGYLRTENKGNITKAEGRIIYEIDNKPAAGVYNNWTGGIISEELATGGTVLSKTTFYPLAKIIKVGGEENLLSIHPLSVNASDHSLTVFANVEEGDELLLMHGDWELLLNRALTTPFKAMESEDISEDEVCFGIYTYCAGTMLAIPEDERPKMPSLVGSVIGGAPFIGIFTFGEQGPIPGAGNYHGNLINSMIVFTEISETEV